MKLCEKQPKTHQSNETKPKQGQHMQKKQQPTFIDPSICLCGVEEEEEMVERVPISPWKTLLWCWLDNINGIPRNEKM